MVSDTQKVIEKFEVEEIDELFCSLAGEKKYKYYLREAEADLTWRKLKRIYPVVLRIFNPIILNYSNMIQTNAEGIIYAPNHRSTLNPLVITPVVNESIHYAALKRFFEGKDSIFNNSKNVFLCRLTAWFFKKLDFFPIDCRWDNPEANNMGAIRDMNNYLRINSKIGIFPEGTTRRKPGQDFNQFDASFIHIAKGNHAWIQPITTLWIRKLGIKSKVIINFGKPFKADGMSIENALDLFMTQQRGCLEENKELVEKLRKEIYLTQGNGI